MGEILTQEEIDALLNSISNDGINSVDVIDTNKKQVKNYDFARPSKFSKEHLRTLEIIFEHYGRLLSTNLPAYLRKNVQVEVMNSEAITYSEFSNALSNPIILGIINFKPLEGNIIIELADNIGYAILDRLLGGIGTSLDKTRDFTEIELVLLERIMNICCNLMIEPWTSVLKIEPRLERIETNSQFAQIISPGEMTSIITMNVRIGNIDGLMNVCIPYACIEPVIDKLNTKYWYSTIQKKDDKIYKEAIEAAINKAKVPVRAILGRSTISVNDFMNLQQGDIIKLDTKVDEELDIFVGNIKKFTALPGASEDIYAVRLTSVIREE